MDQKKTADWQLKSNNEFDVSSPEFKEKNEPLFTKEKLTTLEQMEMALYNLSQVMLAANDKSMEEFGEDSRNHTLDNVFAIASVRDAVNGGKSILHSQGN